MALQAVTFRIRALTSLVFVAIMLTGLLWNTWSFFILFSIIHFGCWYEYQKLVAKIDPVYAAISPFQKYGVAIAGWFIMMYCSRRGFQGTLVLWVFRMWVYLADFFSFLFSLWRKFYTPAELIRAIWAIQPWV